MKFFNYIRESFTSLSNIRDHIDTEAAERNIRTNVYFKGPNILILAFSIVIASVGLNINSTAVIIGAMLVSPLMGPIIGLGLSGGINDASLFRDSVWNLLIMVLISLAASALYFLISPLDLANPTELEARTSPSIFDVLIALFGGAAGILELSRKDKGTVISGVAIATALMPPLCTAGYGIAHLSGHFFFGAMGLFTINAVFIALASYVGVKIFKFKEAPFVDEKKAKRTRAVAGVIVMLIIAASVWSAVRIVRMNNFEISAEEFVAANRTLDKAYIYDYNVDGYHRTLEVKVAGRKLSDEALSSLTLKALAYGINADELTVTENNTEVDDASRDRIVTIFENNEREIARRDARIHYLEEKVDSVEIFSALSDRIAREVSVQYPAVSEVYLARGRAVSADSLTVTPRTTVLIRTAGPMPEKERAKLKEWLSVRLDDPSAEIIIRQ